jgi:hypothetical protein
LSTDLRFPQDGEILRDSFFVIQSQVLGVGSNETLVEHTSGKLVEVLGLDRFKHPRVDLRDAGDVIER